MTREHVRTLATQDSLIPRLINFMGGDPDLYAKDVEYELKKSPGRRFGSSQYIRDAQVQRDYVKLRTRIKDFKDEYVGVEHIYLAPFK